MNHLVAALFTDSKHAGEAVGELHSAGFTKDISVIAKDVNESGENVHQIKQDTKDGAVAGAAAGGLLGGLAAFMAAATPVTIVGLGALLISGPLAALLGATGGALAGGLVGSLVDLGIPDQKARMFEDAIRSGETLVTVSVEDDKLEDVYQVFEKHGAHEAGDVKLPSTAL